MPAGTSSSVGSSAIRLAEGTTLCPRSSKKRRKRRAISADSISAAILYVRSCLIFGEPVLGPQLDFARGGLAERVRGELAHLGEQVRRAADGPAGQVLGAQGPQPADDPEGQRGAERHVEEPANHRLRLSVLASMALRTPWPSAEILMSGPVTRLWVSPLSLAAWALTCLTSLVMASTATSWRLASVTVRVTSSISGSTRSLSSATILVVSLSSRASLTSTITRKQTRIAQNMAAIRPATSPALSISGSVPVGSMECRKPYRARSWPRAHREHVAVGSSPGTAHAPRRTCRSWPWYGRTPRARDRRSAGATPPRAGSG